MAKSARILAKSSGSPASAPRPSASGTKRSRTRRTTRRCRRPSSASSPDALARRLHPVKHLLRALAFIAAFAASGCAELRPLGVREAIDFELKGRIATRYKEEAASGNIAWRHSGSSDELLITTPVGSSVARIVRNGNEVVLTT